MERAPKEVIIAAIIGMVIIECFAMYHGFNGTIRMIIIGAIAGLAGWTLPVPKSKGGD